MNGLTPLQAKALDAIKHLSQGGVCPSLRGLQAELGLSSVSQAHRLVTELEARGAITSQAATSKRRYRSISLVEEVTLLGRPTPQLRHLRDQIDRELRRRAW